MRIIKTKNEIDKVLTRSQLDKENVNAAVRTIIDEVRTRGDAAVMEYNRRFDRYDGPLTVSEEEIREAYRKVSEKTLSALKRARDNILSYHTRQLREDNVATAEGKTTGYVIRPVERAGIYVPGGKAAYPSSVLMCACPAIVAGVDEIVMTTPAPVGVLNPLTIVAARECSVKRIFKAGGAQAVAALAFGTESIPRVDVIGGPGNIYVAMAKRQVYGNVGIDMIAGPSEILIIADETAEPAYLAADMLSQAEHDELSMSMLITANEAIARETLVCVEKQLGALPKKEIAAKALAANGAIVLVGNLNEAIELANRVAPEHLELCVRDPEALLGQVRNAGAVFMGNYSPEPLGDYFAGPNHVLPTSGTARFFSALGVDNYIKKVSVVRYDEASLKAAAEDIITLAECEGLDAHANSIRVRLSEDI